MNKQEKKGLVPALRFPEFQDCEGWKVQKLEKSIVEYRENSTEQDEFEVLTSARSGLVRQRDYYESARITERDNIGFNIIPPGYVTYRSRSDDRRFFFNENNLGITGVISTYYPVFRVLNGSNKFFVELLSRYSRKVGKHSVGTSQTVLSMKELKKIELPIPTETEQQKIADFLISTDELITTQIQKLDVLKVYKKGLMQQLFPAQGEAIPKLRFPEFRNKGDWETAELGGKTIKVGSGITPNGGEKNYKSEGRTFVRSQNVGWGSLILDDVAFIDEETHATFPATEIQNGDVLLNITGASIGRSAVANLKIEGGNVNQHVCIIRTKRKELNPFFLSQFLISQVGQNQIDSFQAGGNRQGLNFAQIRSFAVPMPPKIEEQHRIADCLASIDELIATQAQKIDALNAHRKGLTQQLFPAMDELGS